MLRARIFPVFGSTPIEKISASEVLELRAYSLAEGVTSATANRHVTPIQMPSSEAETGDLLFAAACSGPGCSVLDTVRESEKAEDVEL